jgi:hypothetical protein
LSLISQAFHPQNPLPDDECMSIKDAKEASESIGFEERVAKAKECIQNEGKKVDEVVSLMKKIEYNKGIVVASTKDF